MTPHDIYAAVGIIIGIGVALMIGRWSPAWMFFIIAVCVAAFIIYFQLGGAHG